MPDKKPSEGLWRSQPVTVAGRGDGSVSYVDGARVDVILDDGNEITADAKDVTLRERRR